MLGRGGSVRRIDDIADDAVRFVPTGRMGGPRPPFDRFGFLLPAAAITLLMTAATSGPREGWLSNRILLQALFGTLAATAFVVVRPKGRAPFLDMTPFSNRAFTAAVTAAFVFGAGNFATGYAIPIRSPMAAGSEQPYPSDVRPALFFLGADEAGYNHWICAPGPGKLTQAQRRGPIHP